MLLIICLTVTVKTTLLARGWPADMELNYSLTLRDGVAFYNVLHDKKILSLLAGLVKYNHITTKLAEEGCRN